MTHVVGRRSKATTFKSDTQDVCHLYGGLAIDDDDLENPMHFVQRLAQKGDLTIAPYQVASMKITCNDLSFIINCRFDSITNVDDTATIYVYKGTSISFSNHQAFRDILLMIFYVANKKEVFPELERDELALAKSVINLANILDFARNRDSVEHETKPFMTVVDPTFYSGFIKFVHMRNVITGEQATYALRFLARFESPHL